MRGIAGIVRFDLASVDPTEIDGVIHTMAVVPMDHIGSWHEGPAAFAHLIKSLFVEDRFESQPLSSADRSLVLVTDAMLENRRELAVELGWSAAEAAPRPDSAFVMAAYDRWGCDCPMHLEGQFALVVWDRRERRLFCAVDHFGRRPIYYWRHAAELVLASTLRGMFALRRISREINESTFAAHVVGLDPADPAATLYRDILRLPGGHHLTADATGIRVTRYWNPNPARVLRLPSDKDYLDAFRSEFERAVRTAMERGPRNVGVMVSGGLDSSSVAVMAGKILSEHGQRLQAFHLVPPDENRTDGRLRELDESRFVETLRRHAPHIDFHFVPTQTEPATPDAWDKFFEDDFAPFRGLPDRGDTAFSNLQDRLDIGLRLTGVGGNYLVSLESFTTGYLTHLFVTGCWATWIHEIRGHSRVYGHTLPYLIRKTALGPVKRSLRLDSSFSEVGPLSLLHPSLRARTNIEKQLRSHIAAETALPWDFRRGRHHVLTQVATQQIGVTRSVIRHDLELRLGAAPMFNRRFNEFCLALPFDQQIRHGWDRRLLRESMRGLLPEEVRLRVTRGFPQPAFRRHFLKIEPALRQELEQFRSDGRAGELLDFNWLRSRMEQGAANPFGTYARPLLMTVVLARFLAWYQRL